jgi:hypothetical protein
MVLNNNWVFWVKHASCILSIILLITFRGYKAWYKETMGITVDYDDITETSSLRDP